MVNQFKAWNARNSIFNCIKISMVEWQMKKLFTVLLFCYSTLPNYDHSEGFWIMSRSFTKYGGPNIPTTNSGEVDKPSIPHGCCPSSRSLSSNHTEMQVFPAILRTTPSSSLSTRLWIPTKPRRPQHHRLCVASGDASGGVGLSVSDGELESRGFLVRRTATGLNVEALNEVFARVGFPRRDPARIRRALEHAGGAVVWMEEARSKVEGRPVAFARATGDGVFNAVVWDVVVEPSFQGMGLGRAVMERLVSDLRCMGVSNIALYAEPRVVGFYRPLGFAADPDGIRGMVYSRKNQQQQRR